MSTAVQLQYVSTQRIQPAISVHRYRSNRDCSFHGYVRRVIEILSESDVAIEGLDQIESMVQLALDAQQSFFAAASFHPDEKQLDHFFDVFIRLSTEPCPHSMPQLRLEHAAPVCLHQVSLLSTGTSKQA
jgi:hypothetical protein